MTGQPSKQTQNSSGDDTPQASSTVVAAPSSSSTQVGATHTPPVPSSLLWITELPHETNGDVELIILFNDGTSVKISPFSVSGLPPSHKAFDLSKTNTSSIKSIRLTTKGRTISPAFTIKTSLIEIANIAT